MAAIENEIVVSSEKILTTQNSYIRSIDGNHTGIVKFSNVYIPNNATYELKLVVTAENIRKIPTITSTAFSLYHYNGNIFVAINGGNAIQLPVSYGTNVQLTFLFEDGSLYINGNRVPVSFETIQGCIDEITFFHETDFFYRDFYYCYIYQGENVLYRYVPYDYGGTDSTYHYGLWEEVNEEYPIISYSKFIGSVSYEKGSLVSVSLDNSNIDSLSSNETFSILCDELSYDTMELSAKESISFKYNEVANEPYYNFDGSKVLTLNDWNVDPEIDFEIKFEMDLENLSTSNSQYIFYIQNYCYLQYISSLDQFRFVYYLGNSFDTINISNNVLPADGQLHSFRFYYNRSNDSYSLSIDNSIIEIGMICSPTVSSLSNIVLGGMSSSLSTLRFYGRIEWVYCEYYNRNNSGYYTVYFLEPSNYVDQSDLETWTLAFKNKRSSYSALVNKIYEYGQVISESQIGSVEKEYSSKLIKFQYGTHMYHYLDGTLISKYYLEDSKRSGIRKYEYNCISGIGLLDRRYYVGNVFNGATFSDVISEILGDSIEYSIGTALSNVSVYGWIPYSTQRDAIQQVLFATGSHIFKDENRNILFDYLSLNNDTVEIPQSMIFSDGTVEYPKLPTRIIITEHSYYPLQSADRVTLFDNTTGDPVTNLLAKFNNAPVIVSTIQTTGNLTFSSANVNCAIVSGQGTLTGIPYTHTELNVIREASVNVREEYEISVPNATLVSSLNSDNIADRLAAYYFNYYIVKTDIKWNNEKCGSKYSFIDMFGERQVGYLRNIKKVFSSFVRGQCEFVCGINYDEQEDSFNNYELITSNSIWTIPEGVDKIRLTIIGGGNGGSSGLKGKDAKQNNGGTGGGAGSAGAGGKIFVVTVDVSSASSLSVVVGSAGVGGGANSSEENYNSGTSGGDSTVTINETIYSSANGNSRSSGVINLFTNEVYALNGLNGSVGGRGGNGVKDQSEDGESVNETVGGSAGVSINTDVRGNYGTSSGGGGGGASATTSGLQGGNASAIHRQGSSGGNIYVEWDYYVHTPGNGGDGATATQPTAKTIYGYGGDGGHGGGGGGGYGVFSGGMQEWTEGPIIDPWSGETYSQTYQFGSQQSTTALSVGVGGNGGAGGDGAPGCVLIYY